MTQRLRGVMDLAIDILLPPRCALCASPHEPLMREFPDNAEVRILPLESPTPLRTPGLLTRADAPSSPALRAFVGILRRLVMDHAGTSGTPARPG